MTTRTNDLSAGRDCQNSTAHQRLIQRRKAWERRRFVENLLVWIVGIVAGWALLGGLGWLLVTLAARYGENFWRVALVLALAGAFLAMRARLRGMK